MKLFKRFEKLMKEKKDLTTHPKDSKVERYRSANALVEIELRDK